jgi:hypothetical protein
MAVLITSKSQEIPCLLQTPKPHYYINNSHQISNIHTPTSHLYINFNTVLPPSTPTYSLYVTAFDTYSPQSTQKPNLPSTHNKMFSQNPSIHQLDNCNVSKETLA